MGHLVPFFCAAATPFNFHLFVAQVHDSMIPKKAAPDLIRGGCRFADKITLKLTIDGLMHLDLSLRCPREHIDRACAIF
jgi:hypothetical protein